MLRYNAYFKESVTESNEENYRVRKCVPPRRPLTPYPGPAARDTSSPRQSGTLPSASLPT